MKYKYYNMDSSCCNDDNLFKYGEVLIALSYLYNINNNIYTGKTI